MDKKIHRESFKLVLKEKCFDNYFIKYLYSHIVFTYFDHNDCLCKVDKKIIFDRYLSEDESYSLNKILRGIKEESFIADKSTSIVYEGCNIFEETNAEITKFIGTFSEGTKLDDILDRYNKNNLWSNTVVKDVTDVLYTSKSHFQFNTYQDNPSKDPKVFDYIKLTIPVVKRNMTYEETINYIKEHKKEVNNIIFNLVSARMKRRHLPVNILDFKNSKMILTRQFELVFTVSVKELPNEE